jgi:hypothetical protein
MPKLKSNPNFSLDHEYSNILEVENDNIIMFDCNDTLIEDVPEDYEGETITIECKGFSRKFKPLWKNIEIVKLYKTRSYVVGIWSRDGGSWSEAVTKSLNLENYVDIVMAKPRWYVDNLPADHWMTRIDNNKK